jgi:hypothetical protein
LPPAVLKCRVLPSKIAASVEEIAVLHDAVNKKHSSMSKLMFSSVFPTYRDVGINLLSSPFLLSARNVISGTKPADIRSNIVPFDPLDREALLEHFTNHGRDFNARSPEEYDMFADLFMNKPKTADMEECIREPDRDVCCRYDKVTQEYGTMFIGGFINTYFKPIPGSHLPPEERPFWMHGERTNLDYFWSCC